VVLRGHSLVGRACSPPESAGRRSRRTRRSPRPRKAVFPRERQRGADVPRPARDVHLAGAGGAASPGHPRQGVAFPAPTASPAALDRSSRPGGCLRAGPASGPPARRTGLPSTS
jgi:hypothetical protein